MGVCLDGGEFPTTVWHMRTLMTCWLQDYLPFLGMVILLKYVGLGDSGNISTAGLFHLFDARNGAVYINSNQDTRIWENSNSQKNPNLSPGTNRSFCTIRKIHFAAYPGWKGVLELGGHLKITTSLIFWFLFWLSFIAVLSVVVALHVVVLYTGGNFIQSGI